jgi:multidrug efflux pump subunit AcrA (membrane-fusion protein)
MKVQLPLWRNQYKVPIISVSALLIIGLVAFFLTNTATQYQKELAQWKDSTAAVVAIAEQNKTTISLNTRIIDSIAQQSEKKNSEIDRLKRVATRLNRVRITPEKIATFPDTCRELATIATDQQARGDSLEAALVIASQLDTLHATKDSLRLHTTVLLTADVARLTERLRAVPVYRAPTFIGFPLPSRTKVFVGGVVIGVVAREVVRVIVSK